MRFERNFLNVIVLTALASACSESEPADHGPPPTCLADEEGLGRWEYLPTPIHEPDLLDEDPEPAGPITPSSGTMVWTGSRVLFWGNGKGASFDPETKRWERLPTENGPGDRLHATSIWTGNRWFVWGGQWSPDPTAASVPRSDGALYDPETEIWEPVSVEQAPQSAAMQLGPITGGERESLIWTGEEALLWTVAENEAGECVHQGALLNPETNQWRPMSFDESPLGERWAAQVGTTNRGRHCPSSRRGPLVWTGTELIVWASDVNDRSRARAGIYNPATDTWRTMNLEESSLPRWRASAAWTGTEMLVWGGSVQSGSAAREVTTGKFYNPNTDSWRPMSSVNAPDGGHAAIRSLWTGNELLVRTGEGRCPVGARYDLETDVWSAMSRSPAEFQERDGPVLLWAGTAMLLWGGIGHLTSYDDGALYYP